MIFDAPILGIDQFFANLHLGARYPGYHPFLNAYVMFGQRGPSTLAFLPVLLWAAWRRRSTQPLVLLGTALLLLNVSVGVVKYAIGRVGPFRAPAADVHKIFDGGNIFPSGHAANAVVLYGVVAWVIASFGPRWRKAAIIAATFLSVTVGLTTIYLRTHWFTDIIGGWLAGGLVLLGLPTVMPYAQRWTDSAIDWAKHRWPRLRWPRRVVTQPPRMAPIHGKVAPVSASTRPHSRADARVSFEAMDERTRVG
ncbi:MAG TPA: phosphatase PAP2 family protein [Jatrophihabitans sp.]|nr:phosphatase PAP2 family protein [Jatrophihabitans sp.]